MKRILFLVLMAVLTTITVSADPVAFDRTFYRNAIVLAYSPTNSVYEDDNIKLEIYDEKVWITNKTEKAVFLDLSQCFMIHNGYSSPLNGQTSRMDDKKASKTKVSTSINEYLSVAPAVGSKQNATFICDLSNSGLYKTYGTTESKSEDFSEYEKRFLVLVGELTTESQKADAKGKAYIGTVSRHLTEDESIDNIGVSIAYAFNKQAETWNNVTLTTWVSDVIFAPYYVQLPQDLSKAEQRGFGVKETAPAVIHVKATSPFEFDEDKSPIVVCDWEGNFKKGTFTLGTTRVSKKKKRMAHSGEEPYKSVIIFNGSDADWGELQYDDTKYHVVNKVNK